MGQASAAASKFQASMSGVAKVSNFALASVVPASAVAAGFAIARFGKQSLDAAIQYNAAMTKIAALTDVTQHRLEGLNGTIMNLSSQTAQSPVQLANSMYFLASAGLNVTQQMESLQATAKGAAVGLGDAGDLARISANALNTFGDNGLRAADVMDTLVAAVREGTAEPDEFASALGRVLPIADQAGLSFQQVAASLATMSNAGLNVNLGVTSLRALLQSLIMPTNQTRDALQSIGLTADDVVQSMAQNGLIQTLRTLKDLADKNTSSQGDMNILMRNLIPNIRGLTGAFNLTGQQAGQVNKIFDQVAHSTGDLNTAFEITSQSSAFKIKQAFVDIGRAGQEIASAVLPMIAAALTGLAKVFEVVGKPIAFVVASLLGMNALIGVLTAVAGAAKTFAIAMQFVGVTLTEMFAANPMLTAIALALTAIGVAMLALSGNMKGAVIAVGAVIIEIGRLSGALMQAQASMGAFALAAYAVYEAIQAVQGLMHQTDAAAGDFANTMLSQNGSLQAARDRVTASIGAQPDVMKPWQLAAGAVNGTTLAWDAFNQAAQQVTDTIRQQNQQILDGTPIYGIYGAALDSTENTNEKLHGTLASLIRDYYLQNNGLQGLNMTAVAAAAAQGNLHKAIGMVQQDLGGMPQAFKAASTAMTGTMDSASGVRQTLTSIAQTANLTSRALVDRLQAASTDGKAAVQTFISDTMDGITTWRDTISTSITGVSDVLTTLAGQSNLTATQIHDAFVKAAQDTKNFANDLVTISKVGDGAGKGLASALLQLGPSAAGMANVIATSGTSARTQLVGDFNKILSAGKHAADQLQTAMIGTLKDIRRLLAALARHWGIDISTPGAEKSKNDIADIHKNLKKITGHTWEVHVEAHNGGRGITSHLLPTDAEIAQDVNKNVNVNVHDDATPVLNSLNNYRFDPKSVNVGAATANAYDAFRGVRDYKIPDKVVNVIVHTKAGSPWPDEALDQRLVSPMQKMGFKRTGDTWAVPLTASIHTDTTDNIGSDLFPTGPNSPDNRNRAKVNTKQLLRLIKIEEASKNLLAQINKNIKKMHSAGGSGGSGSSGGSGAGGGTGSGGSAGKQAHDDSNKTITELARMKAKIVDFIERSGMTKKEGEGVRQRIMQPGLNPDFINMSVRQVAAELGKQAAAQYRKVLEHLDHLTENGIPKNGGGSGTTPHGHIDKKFPHDLGSVGRIMNMLFHGGLTPGEGIGTVKKVAAAGSDQRFIDHLVTKMRGEMKPVDVQKLRSALEHLDKSTLHDKDARQKAVKDAIEAMHRLTDTMNKHHQSGLLGRGETPAWAALATKKIPKLPFGHTHIDPNEHGGTKNRPNHVFHLDRKHFVDQESYHIDYSRGY